MPQKPQEEEKKSETQTLLHHASRNTSPQTGTCSTPGEAPFIGPCLAPAGRQRPPDSACSADCSGRPHSRLGKKEMFGTWRSVHGWLPIGRPPATALRTGGWFGVLGAGWLAGWMCLSETEPGRVLVGRLVSVGG